MTPQFLLPSSPHSRSLSMAHYWPVKDLTFKIYYFNIFRHFWSPLLYPALTCLYMFLDIHASRIMHSTWCEIYVAHFSVLYRLIYSDIYISISVSICIGRYRYRCIYSDIFSIAHFLSVMFDIHVSIIMHGVVLWDKFFSYFSLNIMFLTYFHIAGSASSTLLLAYMVYPCIRGWRPRLHSPPATVDILDILPYGTVGDFCLWGVYWQVRLQIYSHYSVRFFFTKATLEGHTYIK